MKNTSTALINKITALLDQSHSLRMTDIDRSIALTNEALSLSRESDFTTLVVRSLNYLSLFHLLHGEYEVSVKLAEEGIEIEAGQEQKDSRDYLERKNEELNAFFHRVSHDLKGPITSLISLDAIYRDDVKDENILKFMDMSLGQVFRINHILDELIKLTRLDHMEEAIQEINFEEIIDGCLSSAKSLPNFDKVKVEVEVESGIKYSGYWALINTIIQNLIENGVQYARVDQPNPFLKMSITSVNGNVKIVADDNGIGMNKDAGKTIFEMFFRTNRQVVASGLGLYILNKAVEKLNGTVELESEIETGSTFTVTLPLTESVKA